MGTTTDPKDPALTHGVDAEPVAQAEKYLVLSDEEIAKGFVEPLRFSYKHVGPSGPTHELRDLTEDEVERYQRGRPDLEYVKYEDYPRPEDPTEGGFVVGRAWTQEQLDAVEAGGCGHITTMTQEIAETYARDPHFYGATYCANCYKHLAVDEFVWIDPVTGQDTTQRVGTRADS